LFEPFSTCFNDADAVVVADVYPAGEAPRPGVTGKLIVEAVLDAGPHRHSVQPRSRHGVPAHSRHGAEAGGPRVAWLPTRPGLVAFLRRELRAGDLCLTLGAGDLTTLPDELLADRR
jgi:UDP-N-acetylmuramate--alanine ligase